ncbi:MAG TPA: GNAT family N-acetyltransferase, partial [Chthoniobacterales bacterium]|nr:GNAT family N-acetyltransferase [Chthoniobacterales bacterium]
GRPCFANRLALYPAGCYVLARDREPVLGYLLAYPWLADDAPALNILLDALPAAPAVMYLHDLALHPNARGAGHAATIVKHLAEVAEAAGWPVITLVAVNNAAAFWQRHGFQIRETHSLCQKLTSYGPDARYMVRALPRAVIG